MFYIGVSILMRFGRRFYALFHLRGGKTVQVVWNSSDAASSLRKIQLAGGPAVAGSPYSNLDEILSGSSPRYLVVCIDSDILKKGIYYLFYLLNARPTEVTKHGFTNDSDQFHDSFY